MLIHIIINVLTKIIIESPYQLYAIRVSHYATRINSIPTTKVANKHLFHILTEDYRCVKCAVATFVAGMSIMWDGYMQ